MCFEYIVLMFYCSNQILGPYFSLHKCPQDGSLLLRSPSWIFCLLHFVLLAAGKHNGWGFPQKLSGWDPSHQQWRPGSEPGESTPEGKGFIRGFRECVSKRFLSHWKVCNVFPNLSVKRWWHFFWNIFHWCVFFLLQNQNKMEIAAEVLHKVDILNWVYYRGLPIKIHKVPQKMCRS